MRDIHGKFVKGHKGYTFWKGKSLAPQTRMKISLKLTGKPLKEETKIKMLGRTPWNKGKKGLVKMSEETRIKMSLPQKGNKHWNWQGGISDKNERIRKSLQYKLWREVVFKRNDYTCQICGLKRGWNKILRKRIMIEADHIKSFALYPNLRLDINNGRTLCKDCHLKTENWGNNSRIFARLNQI